VAQAAQGTTEGAANTMKAAEGLSRMAAALQGVVGQFQAGRVKADRPPPREDGARDAEGPPVEVARREIASANGRAKTTPRF
jgi:hypothetical protein